VCVCVCVCVCEFALIQLWSKLLRWVFVYCNEEVFPFQMISKSPFSKINYVWLTLPESHGSPYVHFTSIKTALTRALVHVLLLPNHPLLFWNMERKIKNRVWGGFWRPYLWHFISLAQFLDRVLGLYHSSLFYMCTAVGTFLWLLSSSISVSHQCPLALVLHPFILYYSIFSFKGILHFFFGNRLILQLPQS